METANWPPEHSAALRDLRARGMSYADIARTINARFKTSYTRNATLGRAQRLGLGTPIGPEPPVRAPSVIEPPGAPTNSNRQPIVEPRPRADVFGVPKRFVSAKKAPRLRCVEITPRHCTVTELEANDCRYPYGGDDSEPITFCGHPRRPGTSYCTPHFHLSRDPEASLEPVLTAAWLELITR